MKKKFSWELYFQKIFPHEDVCHVLCISDKYYDLVFYANSGIW